MKCSINKFLMASQSRARAEPRRRRRGTSLLLLLRLPDAASDDLLLGIGSGLCICLCLGSRPGAQVLHRGPPKDVLVHERVGRHSGFGVVAPHHEPLGGDRASLCVVAFVLAAVHRFVKFMS